MKSYNQFTSEEEIKCGTLLECYNKDNDTKLSCPPDFDGIYCWPSTPTNRSAKMQCFVSGLQNEIVTRWCLTNISEISNFNISAPEWQSPEYGNCLYLGGISFSPDNVFMRYPVKNDSYMDWWHRNMKILDGIGYITSIACLMPALLIFLVFRQLQDTRVKVHINLFSSMFFQSISALIQNYFYGCKIYYTILINESAYEEEHSAICKILTTISHYFELSMFLWLLIEGWYFYIFISLAPYKKYFTIKPLMLVGWVSPILIVIPWIVVHLYYKSNYCWIDMDEKINILAIPIFLIIMTNLGFYILNVRIIFIKMKNTLASEKGMNYWRWIKSSLMLIPLFGTYDILYSISPWVASVQCKIYFLLIMRIICSFKGSIVSILYCFTNGHVKKEIKRSWNNWKVKREIYLETSKHHSQSSGSLSDNRTSSTDFKY